MSSALSRISAIVNNPELSDATKIEQITAALAEASVASSIITRLLALTPRFGWVHPEITDEHFPAAAEPSLEGAQLEAYGKNVSSEFVLADLKAKGRRAGNAAETLFYGIKNPEEQRKHWIVGLGQVWLSPDDGDVVVVLDEDGGGRRRADLYPVVGDWGACRVFLSFPL